MAKKKKTFEQSLQELESIQGKLSDGKLTLDEAIVEYEQGVKLLKECYRSLDVAEKKITILTTDGSRGTISKETAGSPQEEETTTEEDDGDLLF